MNTGEVAEKVKQCLDSVDDFFEEDDVYTIVLDVSADEPEKDARKQIEKALDVKFTTKRDSHRDTPYHVAQYEGVTISIENFDGEPLVVINPTED